MCRYTQFCDSLQTGSLSEASRVHDELLVDLFAIQSHMHRLEATAAAFGREQGLYRAKQEALQTAITTAEADILDRKAQLVEARAELARQQEYETVKQRVVRVPARSTTRAEMASVEREIADLKQQGTVLEAKMQQRKGQFAAIAHMVEQVHLQGAGNEEDEEDDLDEEGLLGEASLAGPMQID